MITKIGPQFNKNLYFGKITAPTPEVEKYLNKITRDDFNLLLEEAKRKQSKDNIHEIKFVLQDLGSIKENLGIMITSKKINTVFFCSDDTPIKDIPIKLLKTAIEKLKKNPHFFN